MKRHLAITIGCICMALLGGCGAAGAPSAGKQMTVGSDIRMEDITDFYYTEENINYDAFYQRYRFYVEDGKQMFFHETRERRDDYGPCTEADTTLTGTMELTDAQWSEFADLMSGGTVKDREVSDEAGGSGPWLYLYWKDDQGKYQQFSFASYAVLSRFEAFCLSLAPKPAEPEEEPQEGVASVKGPYGEIAVELPVDWTGEAVPVDADGLMYGLYGLVLRPGNVDAGRIEIAFMDDFGVCGTGLSEYEENLACGKVTVGVYDDHEFFDFIILKKDKPQIVVQPVECDGWSDETWDEVFMMLNTFFYDETRTEGGIPDAEAGAAGVVSKTYEVTDPDLSEQYIKDDQLMTMVRYYEMTDGTWKTDEHAYKYRLEISGRMGGAVKDSTFVYLSNLEEITFDQAWKAAGLSSNMDDYFDPQDAVLVAMK